MIVAGTTTLPDALVQQLAELYGETHPKTKRRWTLRQLAEFASKELDREVTHPVVERAIKPLREEWAKTAIDVARQRIGAKLPAQLDALDDMLTRVQRDFTRAKSPAQRADALDTYRKGVLLKLRYSGVGERMEVDANVTLDATVTVHDARSALAARLARAAPVAPAVGAGEGGAGPPAGGSPGTPS